MRTFATWAAILALSWSLPGGSAAAEDVPPPEAFRAVVEQPLFRPDRRPAPVTVVPEQMPPPVLGVEPPAITFVGTLRRDGRIRALVSGISPKLLELEPGAEVDGWRVRTVEADRMVLEREGDLLEYRLRPGEGP